VLRPALTEGPYFVDEKLNRSDIRVDPSDNSTRPGVPLTMTLRILGVSGSGCAPIAGAQVDVWHCDAQGVYSDVADPGGNTRGKKFLRGYQVSDAQGVVNFQTIYPGWYQGRATHIHFKIRTDPSSERGRELTSQLFFDEKLNEEIYAQAPYTTKGTRGRTTNAQDGVYREGGNQLLMALTKSGQDYTGTFDVGLKLA
jgi:protocatechuate 3,4-dioxygenase beta subunit